MAVPFDGGKTYVNSLQDIHGCPKLAPGLRWWHRVCKEVRESGMKMGITDCVCYSWGYNPGVTRMNDCIYEVTDTYLTPAQDISPQALQFLRRQWMAAYRKARRRQ